MLPIHIEQLATLADTYLWRTCKAVDHKLRLHAVTPFRSTRFHSLSSAVPATSRTPGLPSVELWLSSNCGYVPQTSELAADLITRMLDPNPKTRLDAAGVMRHPWVRRGLDPDLAALNNHLILARAGLTADELPGGCLNTIEVPSLGCWCMFLLRTG